MALRTERDKKLAMPALIIPAVQVNIRAGELPPASENGVRYLRVPVNVLFAGFGAAADRGDRDTVAAD